MRVMCAYLPLPQHWCWFQSCLLLGLHCCSVVLSQKPLFPVLVCS